MTNELKEFEKARIKLFQGQGHIERKGPSFLPALLEELKKNSKENTRTLIITDISKREISKSIIEIKQLFEECILQFSHNEEGVRMLLEDNISIQILSYDTYKNEYCIRGLGCDSLVLFIKRIRSDEFKKSKVFSSIIIPLFVLPITFSILLYGECKCMTLIGEERQVDVMDIENLTMEDFINIEFK